MGQYYRPTLITPDGRILSLNPHSFDSYSKLTEHSWISNPFVNAAYSLILHSQKRVAWIGDYAYQAYDPDKEAYAKAMTLEDFRKIYDAVWHDDNTGLFPNFFSKRDLSVLDFDTKRMHLVNHDKQAFIDLEAYIRENTVRGGEWDGWCMNPLPLLTACGNGRGGGDFYEGHVGYENIGVWAFDCLEYTDKAPDGYSKVSFYFDEHEEATV